MSPDAITREDAATLHLHLWLQALNRTLSSALDEQNELADRLRGDQGPDHCLSPGHAGILLENIRACVRDDIQELPPIELSRKEADTEADLTNKCRRRLPLNSLRSEASLDHFEFVSLLITVAPQILTNYGRLYGYIVDDLNRCRPSIELILRLAGGIENHPVKRRNQLGPGGALRRLGLLGANHPLSTDLITELAPVPGLTDWLLGATASPPVLLVDSQLLLPASGGAELSTGAHKAAVRCLASSTKGLIGIWGADPNNHDDEVLALAANLGQPVYHSLATGELSEWSTAIQREAAIARGSNSILWIEEKRIPSTAIQREKAEHWLSRFSQRMILTGRRPWRPSSILGSRPYAEILVPRDKSPHSGWPQISDSISLDCIDRLDRKYRLGWRQRRAAVQLALSEKLHSFNGNTTDLPETLENACQLIATPAVSSLVTVCAPQRRLEELILTNELHAQIDEISHLVAHADLVDHDWGFGRLTGSSGSLKALFTGDPGTGKTMAAEVIAGSAGASLMKVDLSQVVSKWVGETEKNLEAVFDHAEQSHSTLFFDEADSLFGRRGEVRHGTDRYANLEVSYLLQRLESFSGGLVILASNLRDEIDPAFTRRFQVALHFPRPGRNERVRLWQLAFNSAPLSPNVNIVDFAELDLTGGAIMTAARMAALLAAAEGNDTIEHHHLIAATERQFRIEARLMAATGQTDGLSIAQTRN